MMKRTVTLTCKKCGRQFRYELNDAVMPEDSRMLRHPLCRKCRLKTRAERLSAGVRVISI